MFRHGRRDGKKVAIGGGGRGLPSSYAKGFGGTCVINRGNYRAFLFERDSTKGAFLKCLEEACGKTGWIVHAWCLMDNHYHLAVETPLPNLGEGMRWLQGTFGMRFNRFRAENGHLFQGRYKSLVVDPGEGLGPLCHYIHLNPVRAKTGAVDDLVRWPWCSLHWMAAPGKRPGWYSPAAALGHAGGLADTPAGRRKYVEYLRWLAEDEPARKAMRFDRMSRGWVIGSKDFKKELIKEHKEAAAKPDPGDREMAGVREMVLREKLEELLRRVGKTEAEVAAERKSAPWKLAVAAAMKQGTPASNRWLAENLKMGSLPEISRKVNDWMRHPDERLSKRVGFATKHKT